MSAEESGFVSRWARRKAAVRRGEVVEPTPVVSTVEVVAPAAPVAAAVPMAPDAAAPAALTPAPSEPSPTLADVALLTRESDYSRFVGAGVDNGVKQAARKKLFADPHFNVMDGLDTYIDDYGKPDPIPLAMLRQLNQSKVLRLFEDDEEDDEVSAASNASKPDEADPATTAAAPPTDPIAPEEILARTDDHADLQLQPNDAARRPGPREGAGA
jgi:Protein of unknown function (DUF3306)